MLVISIYQPPTHMEKLFTYSRAEFPGYGGVVYHDYALTDYGRVYVSLATYSDAWLSVDNVVTYRSVVTVSYKSCVDQALSLIDACTRRKVPGRYMVAAWPTHVQAVRIKSDGAVQFLKESRISYDVYADVPDESGEYTLMEPDVFRLVADSMMENKPGLRNARIDDVVTLVNAARMGRRKEGGIYAIR